MRLRFFISLFMIIGFWACIPGSPSKVVLQGRLTAVGNEPFVRQVLSVSNTHIYLDFADSVTSIKVNSPQVLAEGFLIVITNESADHKYHIVEYHLSNAVLKPAE